MTGNGCGIPLTLDLGVSVRYWEGGELAQVGLVNSEVQRPDNNVEKMFAFIITPSETAKGQDAALSRLPHSGETSGRGGRHPRTPLSDWPHLSYSYIFPLRLPSFLSATLLTVCEGQLSVIVVAETL